MSNKQRVTAWRQQTKVKAVLYKGGACLVCNYDRCSAALDFHHLNEDQKNFNISLSGLCRAWLTIKAELDKCVLLCKCCHAEHHYGDLELSEHLHKNPTIEAGDQALRDAGYDPYYAQGMKVISRNGTLYITPKGPNTCLDCSVIIAKGSTRCRTCASYQQPTKITWPSIRELKSRIASSSYSAVARELGVSDNAVRKRIKNHQ
jgi:hypothetical protein